VRLGPLDPPSLNSGFSSAHIAADGHTGWKCGRASAEILSLCFSSPFPFPFTIPYLLRLLRRITRSPLFSDRPTRRGDSVKFFPLSLPPFMALPSPVSRSGPSPSVPPPMYWLRVPSVILFQSRLPLRYRSYTFSCGARQRGPPSRRVSRVCCESLAMCAPS